MGPLGGSIDEGTLRLLDNFADALGLAFQVRDDILDVESNSDQLGKTVGKDAAQAKCTYPALLGMDGAKAKLKELDLVMHEALTPFRKHATALWALGKLAIHRTS
jgi:farnesyl diphosphate synthase